MKIAFEMNGQPIRMDVADDRRAVDLLREDLGMTGTKEGCGTGECGACTILVDGRSRLSCLMLACQLDGHRITTIEGLARGGELHPVQTAFVEKGAVQCGFCTPGMVLTTVDLLERDPNPSRQAAATAISGNLCRCTGYKKILDAIGAVGEKDPLPSPTPKEMSAAESAVVQRQAMDSRRKVFLPRTVDALWKVIADHPGVQVFGGGTDLMVWMRSRRVSPAVLVGLERIEALNGITENDTTVSIGAATSHAAILENPLVRKWFPVLVQALETLGSPHIRRMGTLGGNIMTASPAGDSLPPLLVLGATVELRSALGTRRLSIEKFILGPGQTALKPGEILTAVSIPKTAEDSLHHFEKVGLRKAMACAVASLAAIINVSSAGRFDRVRLAWGSVGPTVVRLPDVENALVGRPLSRDTLESVLPLVQKQLTPIDDVRASAAYRRQVAGNLLLRLTELADGSSRRCDPPEAES